MRYPSLPLVALAIAIGGVAVLGFSQSRRADHTVSQSNQPSCQAPAEPMQRIELVFGLSRKNAPEITDGAWQAFVDGEITPRFPDGLTIFDARGQWRTASGPIVKEPARLLLIWARPTADLGPRIEAVRDAWKRTHAQESVVRADRSECVSF